MYPLTSAATVDGLHFGLYRHWQDLERGVAEPGTSLHVSVPYHIENVLNSASHLTPRQRQELQNISAEFSRMGATP